MKAKKNKPLFTVPVTAELIWASSAYAYRINEGYARDTELLFKGSANAYESDHCYVSNQILAHYAIMHPEVMDERDYLTGKDMLSHFSGLVFKGLQKKLSDFDKSVLGAVERNDWNDQYEKYRRQHFGIVVSLPKSYYREVKRDAVQSRLARAHSVHLGELKERLKMKVQIVRSVYSKQWNTFYITAMKLTEEVVFFSFKEELTDNAIYDIAGTVKAHRDNSQTQLNRVKIVKAY